MPTISFSREVGLDRMTAVPRGFRAAAMCFSRGDRFHDETSGCRRDPAGEQEPRPKGEHGSEGTMAEDG